MAEAAKVAETLRLEGVRKSYGVGTPAAVEVLHGIGLTLNRGEFAALIGPSGSGKSTLLNLIGLLDQPTAGKLIVTGRTTAELDDRELTELRAKAIGFVFQHHHLLPEFTAQENVMLPLLAASGWPNEAMRARAAELIDKVGLSKWAAQMSGNLSGGQQQRVAIARALVMNPALVLADEPTGNLDSHTASVVFGLLIDRVREQQASLIVVTHDQRLAAKADRVLNLNDGILCE